MAGDLKPTTISLASSANMYAGSELDRSQVMQFIGLLTQIAMVAHGGLILIAHPSLTGIQTETGLSGSTQWHNSTRARMYLKGAKLPGEQDQQASKVHELAFLKNQYGPPVESIYVQWQNGLYLPINSANVNAVERAARAREVFLILLKRFNSQNRNASANGGPTYAPTLFAEEQEARKAAVSKDDLAEAMRVLLATNQIVNETYGRADRPSSRLIINPTPGEERL
jgi:RecA-family ATPase